MRVYERNLVSEGHTVRFVIDDRQGAGWEVVEERDRHVVRQVRYDDWHRGERRREAFARQVTVLRKQGWLDSTS